MHIKTSRWHLKSKSTPYSTPVHSNRPLEMGSLNNSPMVAESGHKKNVIDEKRSAATGGGGGKAYVDSRAELQKPVIEVRGRQVIPDGHRACLSLSDEKYAVRMPRKSRGNRRYAVR